MATGAEAASTPLDRQQVLATALALVDANGLEALSMRKLGAELGVDPMAVYRHVTSKDALLDALAEQLWVEIRDTIPDSGDWADRLRGFAHALRAVMHGHPQAASLLLSHCDFQVPMLEVYATLLDTLRDAGFDEAASARAVRSLESYAIAYASNELYSLGAWQAEPGDQPAADTPAPQDYETTEILLWLGRILPPGTPSRLVKAALAMIDSHLEGGDFDTSLDMVIQGLRP